MIDNIRKSKFSFSRESPRLAKLDLFKNQLKGIQHNNLDDFMQIVDKSKKINQSLD